MLTAQVKLNDLETYVERILELISKKSASGAKILTLQGDLGAGKTTFVQALAKKLGVEEVVTSPTFVVMRVYDTNHQIYKKLVHIDAYRFTDPAEVVPLRLDELLLDPDNLVCIEWAERLGDSLLETYQTLKFQILDEETREITYEEK